MVVSALVGMLPGLLGISFSFHEMIVPPFQGDHVSYTVEIPSTEIVSITPLFAHPTQFVVAAEISIRESGTSSPPINESVITVQALAATGLSRSYTFTVVRVQPVSPPKLLRAAASDQSATVLFRHSNTATHYVVNATPSDLQFG